MRYAGRRKGSSSGQSGEINDKEKKERRTYESPASRKWKRKTTSQQSTQAGLGGRRMQKNGMKESRDNREERESGGWGTLLGKKRVNAATTPKGGTEE